MQWNGYCYQLYTGSLTLEEVRARCEALGGHLATITSQAEQNAVSSLLNASAGSYWLGARTDDAGWWKWITDEFFERQYQNFAQGQPDGAGNRLAMQSSGSWYNIHSSETVSGFICEWDNEPETVRAAQVAPSFAEWLANPELRANSDGTAPSPLDMSHLRNNLPRVSGSSAFAAADTMPTHYDAREDIGLPEARNQGEYNTCWAFASIGALEASYRKQNLSSLGEYPDLSELHLAWFTYKTIHSKDNT